MTVDITQIIISILSLVISVVAAWAGKTIIPRVNAWLDAKTTNEQRKHLNNIVRQLVLAAEQVMGAKCGVEKRAYVIDELRKRGLTIDFDAIEAAVKEMNNEQLFLSGEAEDGDDLDWLHPPEYDE